MARNKKMSKTKSSVPKPMKFWLLGPKTNKDWHKWPKTCSAMALVAAKTEKDARQVAAEAGGKVWYNKKKAKCKVITPEEFVVPCLVVQEIL